MGIVSSGSNGVLVAIVSSIRRDFTISFKKSYINNVFDNFRY